MPSLEAWPACLPARPQIKVPNLNSPASSPARPRALSALASGGGATPMSPGSASILSNQPFKGARPSLDESRGDPEGEGGARPQPCAMPAWPPARRLWV